MRQNGVVTHHHAHKILLVTIVNYVKMEISTWTTFINFSQMKQRAKSLRVTKLNKHSLSKTSIQLSYTKQTNMAFSAT
jgi:small-conductance mechanosensitive channel